MDAGSKPPDMSDAKPAPPEKSTTDPKNEGSFRDQAGQGHTANGW